MDFNRIRLACVAIFATALLSACPSSPGSDPSSPGATSSTPVGFPDGGERPRSTNPCRSETGRLDQGLGYCFDAFFYSTHDRSDVNDPRSGTKIDFTVYVPHPDKLSALVQNRALTTKNNVVESGYSPLLIHSHGFGGSKQEEMTVAEHFVDEQAFQRAWDNGYFGVSFSQRGFGQSGGQIAFMQRELEGLDANELVDWMIKHMRGESGSGGDSIYDFVFDENNDAHIDPSFDAGDTRPSLLRADNGARLAPQASCSDPSCNPALGSLGYSYGGGWQYNASITDTIQIGNRTPQDRWDALVPEGTWHDLRYSLSAHDLPKGYWAVLLYQFALEGGTGSNGEPLPDYLNELFIAAQTPATGAAVCNQGASDPLAAGAAAGRVCAADLNFAGLNGTNAYCDPVSGSLTNSALFHIQGVRDTLFNFNEGYDNAQCFRKNGNDVRYLAVSGGHPYTISMNAPYTGNRTSMDIDEVVHCELPVDADGDNDIGQERLYVSDLIYRWFEEKLRGQTGQADIIPDVCIAQHNTDPSDSLDGDPNFTFSGSSSFYYLKEGLSYFDSQAGTALDQILVGAGDTPNYTCDASSDHLCPVNQLVTLGGAAGQSNTAFVPLVTISNARVMAGFPLAKFSITGLAREFAGSAVDPVILMGIAVLRDGQRLLLHDQLTPIRDTNVYPWADRFGVVNNDINDIDDTDTPVYYGCGQEAEALCDRGRLVGITARLLPGDVVGIEFRTADPQYPTLNNLPGTVTIVGDVELPILAPSPLPPVNVPYDPEA